MAPFSFLAGGRLLVDKEAVLRCYAEGFSTRQVAAKLGVSKTYVAKICRSIARPRAEAVAARQPLTSSHWRTTRASARRYAQRVLGRKLAPNEHVHHKNGDYTDNRLENLEVIGASEHSKFHNPKNPVPRHLRPERQAYMREWRRRRHEQAVA